MAAYLGIEDRCQAATCSHTFQDVIIGARSTSLLDDMQVLYSPRKESKAIFHARKLGLRRQAVLAHMLSLFWPLPAFRQ